MQVLGGKYRKRNLQSPPLSSKIRPTSVRVRDSCFNVLSHSPALHHVMQGDFVALDAFAGTGIMGIEALSRGARFVHFFDNSNESLAIIKNNLKIISASDNCKVYYTSAIVPPVTTEAVDLVFIDPPYGQGLIISSIMALTNSGWLKAGTILAIEHHVKESIVLPVGIEILDERTYGEIVLKFAVVNH